MELGVEAFIEVKRPAAFLSGELVDAVGEVAVVLSCSNDRVHLLRGREDSTGQAHPQKFYMFADCYWPEALAAAKITDRLFDSGAALYSVLIRENIDDNARDEIDALLLEWDKLFAEMRHN